jgi:hypothetical protein
VSELSRISWTPSEEVILGVSSWKRRPLESGRTEELVLRDIEAAVERVRAALG